MLVRNMTGAPTGRPALRAAVQVKKPDPVSKPFFWLTAFYFVYCARPEDWITPLAHLPLAKITAICAFIGLVAARGKTKRTFRDFPIEASYLAAMIGLLYVGSLFSPIWRGGALAQTIAFSKAWIVYALTFLLITDFAKLKKIIFIQSASVPLICTVSIIKGHSTPRLDGVIGGIYSNPNDLAFAIVLTLPFCLAFLLTSKDMLRRLAWVIGMLIMALALVMTASRAGFVTILISGSVCLWHFGVKGRRFVLIIATVFSAVLVLAVAGGPLFNRLAATTGQVEDQQQQIAYSSYEARQYLMQRALEGIEQYPVFGVGARNFPEYSLVWHDVHMSYLQIAVEGGIPCVILYILFFWRGFKNLKKLRRLRDLDVHTSLFVGGLHASMIGFAIGAMFAPEAYQFFPYFAVAYTSALFAIIAEREKVIETPRKLRAEAYARFGKPGALMPVR